MTSSPKLVFCFPYRGVGGVSLLFLRVAEELASTAGVETYLVDYIDGFMAKHRRPQLTRFIEYRDDEVATIPDDAIVVFQSMTPWSIYPSLQMAPTVRIFYWNCYPFNLVPTLPGFRRYMQNNQAIGRVVLATILRGYRNKMVRLIRLLLTKRSLVFMDAGNVSTTEAYLDIAIPDPVFLPIPVVMPVQRRGMNIDFQSNGLRIAWLGRVVDFKYHILKHALRKLNNIQPDIGGLILVTIIGSGDFDEELQKDVLELRNLSVEFVKHIAPNELDEFLCKNVDVLMAMGTSALEGAKLGIPTILLDVSYGEVPDGYRFQWLHEKSGYSLGEVIDKRHLVAGNQSLRECLHRVLVDYSALSDLAFAHFERHHSLHKVAIRLLKLAEETECTYGDFSKARLVGRGKVYAVFNFLRKRIV